MGVNHDISLVLCLFSHESIVENGNTKFIFQTFWEDPLCSFGHNCRAPHSNESGTGQKLRQVGTNIESLSKIVIFDSEHGSEAGERGRL